MKTFSDNKMINCLTLFIILILSTTESFSQQIITFTDRTQLNVFITYQTEDTVKYYLPGSPDIMYIETMNHIAGITPFELLAGYHPDSLSNSPDYTRYLKYKHMTIGGSILITCGALTGAFGIAGFVSAAEDDGYWDQSEAYPFFGIIAFVGTTAFLTGVALTIAGAVNMQKYKEKLHGFSVNLRYTPQIKGISVAYKF